MAGEALPGMSLVDTYALVRATVGEAANQSPDVQQAIASTVLNRANATGKPIADIASDDAVYQGYNHGPALHIDPSSPTYKAVFGNLAPVATGGPTTDATHFYAPKGMANGAKPSWDNGTGKTQGDFVFLNRSDTLPSGSAPPDSAFAGGSTTPAGQAPGPDDAAPPDTAFAGGSLAPGGPPMAQPPQGAPAAPLPAPNMLGYDPALKAPSGPVDEFARSTGATLRGLANGASFGLADKITAADGALPALVHGGLPAFQSQYTSNMNAEQAQNEADKQQVPIAHYPAVIAGVLAQAGLMPAAPAASLLGRGAIGAGQGALLSGLNAAGNARGNLGEVGAQTGVPMLGGAALGGPLGGIFGAAPAAMRGAPASLADHAATGVDPMLATSGPRWAQQLGQTLKGIPIVGAPLAQAATKTAGQLDNAVTGLGAGLGTAKTPFEAGGAAIRGAKASVEAMKAKANALYAPLNDLENSTVKVPALHTMSAINDIYSRFPNLPGWLSKQAPKLASLQKTLRAAGGAITFGELKSLRTDVGSMIEDHTLVGNVDQGRLKQIYKAMSKDMENGVAKTARQEVINHYAQSPAPWSKTIQAANSAAKMAQSVLKRANAYNHALHERADNVLDQVVNAKSNEHAFLSILAAGKSGARADIQQLTLLKRSMMNAAPEEWGNISAGVVNTMGRDTNGHFSVDKFDTELNNLTPEAKRLMFGEDAPALEAIGRIAKQQKAAGKFYNHSNSGHVNAAALFLIEPLGEITQHLMSGHLPGVGGVGARVAGTMGGGYGAARLLASPGFARLALSASKARSLPSAQLMDRMLGKYAAEHGDVSDLVAHYRQVYLANARANFAPAMISAPQQLRGPAQPQAASR